jgi:predicted acetyltransferase
MPETSIRQLQGQDMLDAFYNLASYAFHPSPPLTDRKAWQEWVEARQDSTFLALFEGKMPVACVISSAMTQNVRGNLYAQSGVWGVITAPAARRKGYCRRLMTALFAAGHERGQVFSCLYPFRESFYENLGYVTFPAPRLVRFAPNALLPLLKQNLGGQVQLVPIRDGFDEYQTYLHQRLERVHGMAMYTQPDTSMAKQNNLWLAKALINGQLEGLMLYKIQGSDGDEGKFQFRADRIYYNSSQAKYLLLEWIARHVDQADRVLSLVPPDENPETWLSDLNAKTESFNAPMGRILDVANISGLRVGVGSFSAHIRDPFCPWNESVWRFESVDHHLQISPAGSADCELSIQALSALVYGAHAVGDFAYRGWGNPSTALQTAMQEMFPSRTPYLDEMF